MDTETARLSDLSTQLAKAQLETNDARTKQKSGGVSDRLPEVSADSVVEVVAVAEPVAHGKLNSKF